jgi:hypothetical protein
MGGRLILTQSRKVITRHHAFLEQDAPGPPQYPHGPIAVPELERLAFVQRLLVAIPRDLDHVLTCGRHE